MCSSHKGMQTGTFPSVKEMIDTSIKVYVCETSKRMLGLDKVKLIPGVKIVGAGQVIYLYSELRESNVNLLIAS